MNDAYSGLGTGGYTLHYLQHAHLCRDCVAVVLCRYFIHMLLACCRCALQSGMMTKDFGCPPPDGFGKVTTLTTVDIDPNCRKVLKSFHEAVDMS